jgi:DNA polymerase-3 subunit delta'
MGFEQFHGNAPTVRRLREMISRDHLPHAIILTGSRGAGKFTLAQMVAKAVNCLQPPISDDGLPDFCGLCRNCERIAQADALDQRFAEAVEARENLRESDKRETRIFVQTHPEVLVIPPDPPQMLVKVDQVRHVIGEMYYRPA